MLQRTITRSLRWTAILAVLVLMVALFIAIPRSPYAFLNSFNPRYVEVDLKDIRIPIAFSPPKGSRITLLVFRYEDAPKVLGAIRASLTPERGFNPGRWNAASTLHGEEAFCEFVRGMPPTAPSMDPPDDGVLFSAGRSAEGLRSAYEDRQGQPSTYREGAPACIVLLSERPTWFDQAIGRIFHFTRE